MTPPRVLSIDPVSGFRALAGVGGVGTGIFFALQGNHTLGRNESRPGRRLDIRDYCKLHIISHYVALLLGAHPLGNPFRVSPIAKVGDDAAGSRLLDEMAAAGIDLRFVSTAKERPTLLSICFQYPDGSGGNVTTSESAASLVSAKDIDAAVPFLASVAGGLIGVALPEVPLDVRRHFLQVATRLDAVRVASFTTAEIAGARDSGMLSMIDLLALNEDEAQAISGVAFDSEEPERFLEACKAASMDWNPQMQLIVTAGKRGCYGFADGTWEHCPAADVVAVSTAGAGDALLAGVLAGLASGMPFTVPGPRRKSLSERPLASALELGSLLGSFSVTSAHTIAPDATLETLLDFAAGLGVTFGDSMRRHWEI